MWILGIMICFFFALNIYPFYRESYGSHESYINSAILQSLEIGKDPRNVSFCNLNTL